MHILIGLITSFAGLIWALHYLQRSGVDLNDFNPFLWMRRRDWEKRRELRPVFALEQPIEIAVLLLVAIAKEGGELIAKDRERLVEMFTGELKLAERYARELLTLAEHMLRDGPSIVGQIDKVVAPCKDRFSEAQVRSLAELLRQASGTARLSERQASIIRDFEAMFAAAGGASWAKG
ncbi:MAG TPA: hypothetical protein VLI06_08630 [Solimonas sp.]|nr:hypothetical protein [Solimonas sp.]